MTSIRRYALTLLAAAMLTVACPVTTFASMEGLAEMQETETTTGLTNANELTDTKSTEATSATSETSDEYKGGSVHDTGNAVNDILDNKRFAGAMSSITKVTNVVDGWFIIIISIVAFFIISAALLKNVCAGAYVANPKFWDIVHESHNKVGQQSIAGLRNIGQTITNASFSSIRDILLVIVPDLKSFTDFEDASSENIDPKAYFAKSIPQMLLCVIIGIFIYNGYYRDTASKVGAFGAESFERFIGEADPVALADRIYNTTGKPATKYDGNNTLQGQVGKALADKTYSLYVSTYHDLTGPGTKAALMKQIVADTDKVLEVCKPYLVADSKTRTGYKYDYALRVVAGAEDPTDPKDDPDASKDNSHNIHGVFSLITNDSLGIHFTDIKPETTGMQSVSYTITFTENADEYDAADGVVTITFNSSSDEVTLDAFNDALTAANIRTINPGTGVKMSASNSGGQYYGANEYDGKIFNAKIATSDSVAAGSVKVSASLDEK